MTRPRRGRTDRSFRHPAEGRALEFLEQNSHLLICHNYQTRTGEIDLITSLDPSANRIHFTEVKSYDSVIHPLESLHPRKIGRQRKVAQEFLLEYGYSVDTELHFDLVWIKPGGIELFEDVF